MTAARCLRCSSWLPVRVLEGVRAPVLSRSLAFDCPNCGARLIIDYWDRNANVFRVLFVFGAIALAIGSSWLGFGMGTVAIVFAAYIVLGWLALLQLRKVVYADSRHAQVK
jgi:predicted RNA-binding Zn-ribbon protein involved in translation (DUF1610 family)